MVSLKNIIYKYNRTIGFCSLILFPLLTILITEYLITETTLGLAIVYGTMAMCYLGSLYLIFCEYFDEVDLDIPAGVKILSFFLTSFITIFFLILLIANISFIIKNIILIIIIFAICIALYCLYLDIKKYNVSDKEKID